MKKILVVHALNTRSRLTTIKHDLCFSKYATGYEVYYVNIFGFLNLVKEFGNFDLMITTYGVLDYRNTFLWPSIEKKLKELRKLSSKYIILPQDDYTCCHYLDTHAVNFQTDLIYSPISEDLDSLYPKSLKKGIHIKQVLTGYLDLDEINHKEVQPKLLIEREIDIGQRVRHLSPIFGELGQRKSLIANLFITKAQEHEFVIDFSTDDNQALIGEAWGLFLSNVRFTISRKGGASFSDPRGIFDIMANWFEILGFETKLVESILNKFKKRHGNFTAISPRLFEAALFGVCQILEKDNYLSVLKPWVHYIPLEPDLSNFDEVVNAMKNLSFCQRIVDNSRELILNTKEFTYKYFVESIIEEVLNGSDPKVDAIFIDIDSFAFKSSALNFNNFVALRSLAFQEFIPKFVQNKKNKINSKEFNVNVLDLSKNDYMSHEFQNIVEIWKSKVKLNEILAESLIIDWLPASIYQKGF